MKITPHIALNMLESYHHMKDTVDSGKYDNDARTKNRLITQMKKYEPILEDLKEIAKKYNPNKNTRGKSKSCTVPTSNKFAKKKN